jgi:hypothetical protein
VGNYSNRCCPNLLTIEEIRNVLVSEYEVELNRCERNPFALFQKLADKGLVEVRNGTLA